MAVQEATTAREAATRAQEEAAAIRKKAEAEVNRLQQALGQIAETRRTALGLVMNLGVDTRSKADRSEQRHCQLPSDYPHELEAPSTV